MSEEGPLFDLSESVDAAFTELQLHFTKLQTLNYNRNNRMKDHALDTRSAYLNLRSQLTEKQIAAPLLDADAELQTIMDANDKKAELAAKHYKKIWGVEASEDLMQMFRAQHFSHKLKGNMTLYEMRPSARFLFSSIFAPASGQTGLSADEALKRANIAGAFDSLCRAEVHICDDDLDDTYTKAIRPLKRLFTSVGQVKLPDGSKLSDLDWSSPHGVNSARTIFSHPDCWTSESAFYGAFTVHHITKLATKEPSLRGKEIDIHVHADLLSKIAYTSLFLPGWTYAGETWRLMGKPQASHPPS